MKPSVQIQFEENEGYDYGLFYKGFNAINPDEYSQIACINDSNIIFGRLNFLFDWSKNQQVDFWGLVDSREKPWFSTHADNYHVQSHFIVFNSTAISILPEYFAQISFSKFKKEKDAKKLRRKVINDWEIGLTQFLLGRELSCSTFIDSHDYALRKGILKPINITHKHYANLIRDGIPIIKKRLVMDNSFRNRIRYMKKWSRLIRKYGSPNWKIEPLIDDLNEIKSANKDRA